MKDKSTKELVIDEKTKEAFKNSVNPAVQEKLHKLHEWRKQSLKCNYIF